MQPAAPADRAVVPLVSVLVPVYNAAATIGRALDSILAERSIDIEVIVIDDGSTDRTVAVAGDIAQRDPRLLVIARPDNGGVSEARNDGLRAARGQWLTFVDADDRLMPGGIAALVAPIRSAAPLAVIGQRVWSDGERTWVSSFYDIPDIRRAGRKSLASHPGLLYYASATGKLIHRSCTTGLWFSGRVLGDQPWTIRALLRAGDRIEVIADTVYEWTRPTPESAAQTITSSTRSSARLGVDAAAIAEEALASVRAEAEASLSDPVACRVVSLAYAERLLRSDLGVHLAKALKRRDPTIAQLLAAIEAFIATVPPELLRGSPALARAILEPPLRDWATLGEPGRAAYWSLFAAATAADPDVAAKGTNVVTRSLLRLAMRQRALGRPARILFRASRAPRAIGRRVRRFRRGVR